MESSQSHHEKFIICKLLMQEWHFQLEYQKGENRNRPKRKIRREDFGGGNVRYKMAILC